MTRRVLFLGILPLLAAFGPPSTAGALDGLAFLSGCWRGEFGSGMAIEETWTEADSDVMLATTRYLRAGRTVEFEFSRIQADSAGIALVPYPQGRMSDAFPLDSVAAGLAVFANPAHDFPKRIIYRRSGETLTARIEDDTRGREWAMTPCR